MGLPVTGAFARAYQGSVAYAGAGKWGTGINPVHAQYAGPPRPFGPGVPNDLDQRQHPATSSEDLIEYGPPWGAPDDPSYLDAVASEQIAMGGVGWYPDGLPDWSETTTETRAETEPGTSAPWGTSGVKSGLHYHDAGPHPDWEDSAYPQIPSETVSEGWINKGSSGKLAPAHVANSEPADDSQVFVQTSMTQRYKEQNNSRAQLRDSDDARTPIASRVTAQKVKYFSGGLRHYDMFPYQIDDIPRPFYYRTAALGPNPYLAPNEMVVITPLQRTPPPEPSGGTVDTSISSDGYGYTSEDGRWY